MPIVTRGIIEFGYKSMRKVDFGKVPHYILVACKNLWSKYGDFNFIYLFICRKVVKYFVKFHNKIKAKDTWQS